MIQIDKITHFFVCYSLAVTVGLFMPLWAALFTPIVIGALKEIYDDLSGKGSPEWFDFLADCIGAIIGSLIIIIYES